MSTNPLLKYYRQPKIFIRLPSQGKFYPPGTLDVSHSGEYAVYAMTAKDELLLRTPDALLNGEATVQAIRSCIPAITDPWSMPSIDVDSVLCAIRIASYGENMDLDSHCPECDHENRHVFNLVNYLSQNAAVTVEDHVTVEDLTVSIRPYSYREMSNVRFKTMQQQNVLRIVNDPNLSDEEKYKQFESSFLDMAELTIQTISGCITAIATPDGTVVTDLDHIREFIENSSKEVFKAVSALVKQMKNDVSLQPQPVTCQNPECGHAYSINVSLDQSNFFKVESQE